MIPIFSVNLFVGFLASVIIVARLLVSYRKQPSEVLYHFVSFFSFLGIFFLSVAFPIFLPHGGTLRVIQAISSASTIGYFAFYIGLAYGIYLPLIIIQRRNVARVFFWAIICFGIAVTFMRFFENQLSVLQMVGPYVYWEPVFSPFLRVATGVLAGVVLLVSAAVFFVEGARHRRDFVVFRKSMWLGAGFSLLTIAAVTGFVLAVFGYFSWVFLATAIVIVGLFAILRGVLYRSGVVADVLKRS